MKKNKDIPVTLEHAKLRQVAAKLAKLGAQDEEILSLSNALHQIGCGEDANVVHGVKRTKGQDEKKELAHYWNQMAIRWIAGRMNPIDPSEVPPFREQAIREAAEHFDLDVGNLKRACPSEVDLRKMVYFEWDSQRPQLKKPRD